MRQYRTSRSCELYARSERTGWDQAEIARDKPAWIELSNGRLVDCSCLPVVPRSRRPSINLLTIGDSHERQKYRKRAIQELRHGPKKEAGISTNQDENLRRAKGPRTFAPSRGISHRNDSPSPIPSDDFPTTIQHSRNDPATPEAGTPSSPTSPLNG